MLLKLDVNFFDWTILAIYFTLVVAIGVMARRAIATSEDFLLAGRSLPAWVTGIAFISANLGAIEILGMAANGAQYGMSTLHFYWIGAVPAMVFLGLVMMPFYYGSRVRTVPEFLLRRFNPATHLFNALSFAAAAVLTAGVNLFALALVINALIGWPIWVSIMISAGFVLAYITLGGLSGAIYNEVLQFFVIVAGLVPLVVIGLHSIGGYAGLKEKVTHTALGPNSFHTWAGTAVGNWSNPLGDWIGIVMGLGFVLSFGYSPVCHLHRCHVLEASHALGRVLGVDRGHRRGGRNALRRLPHRLLLPRRRVRPVPLDDERTDAQLLWGAHGICGRRDRHRRGDDGHHIKAGGRAGGSGVGRARPECARSQLGAQTALVGLAQTARWRIAGHRSRLVLHLRLREPSHG